MRILLDENLPRKLRTALIDEGHEVGSVHSLRLDGIANGALYDVAQRDYDFFSRATQNSQPTHKPRNSARP